MVFTKWDGFDCNLWNLQRIFYWWLSTVHPLYHGSTSGSARFIYVNQDGKLRQCLFLCMRCDDNVVMWARHMIDTIICTETTNLKVTIIAKNKLFLKHQNIHKEYLDLSTLCSAMQVNRGNKFYFYKNVSSIKMWSACLTVYTSYNRSLSLDSGTLDRSCSISQLYAQCDTIKQNFWKYEKWLLKLM